MKTFHVSTNSVGLYEIFISVGTATANQVLVIVPRMKTRLMYSPVMPGDVLSLTHDEAQDLLDRLIQQGLTPTEPPYGKQ